MLAITQRGKREAMQRYYKRMALLKRMFDATRAAFYTMQNKLRSKER